MLVIHEMRAYCKPRDETAFDVVGFICLDEDRDPAIDNIYEDARLPSCGSNWQLVDTGVDADGRGWKPGCYYYGDWHTETDDIPVERTTR